jgi:hypothetical protein
MAIPSALRFPLGRRTRAPLSVPERIAVAAIALAVTGFGVSGALRDVPGTVEYVLTVTGVVAVVALVRRQPLPPALGAVGVASVVLHLAGGLVRVGDGVLYNASAGTEVLRYDHLAHVVGIFTGTWLLWELLVRGTATVTRTPLIALALLAGLGLGALNETVEFLATQVHAGGHVGGYTNTGWDLVVNTTAGLAAGLVLRRRTEPTA